MSIGFKIKKLREERNLSQPNLASELHISQSELSKIENGQTKKIDFLFMDRVCSFFEKDFEFFTENDHQINNIKKLDGSVNNHGTINFFPENIIEEIKKLIEESKQKDEIINLLKGENQKFRQNN
jgi:transcriptional regulator with XRE-family HTH domain